MRDLTEILAKMDNAIERYETCKLSITQDQSEILRDLSVALHFLALHRNEYHKNWMSVYFASRGGSATAKEKEADFKVPELYMIRQFMTSGNKVLDSMRTTISASKNDQVQGL